MGDLQKGQEASAKVKLELSKFQTCPLENIAIDTDSVRSSNLSMTLNESGHLLVDLEAQEEPGDYVEHAILNLTDCWRESIRIPIRWKVVARHSVSPGTIYAGQVKPGQQIHKLLVISGPKGEPIGEVEIVGTNPKNPAIESDWKALSLNRGKLTINMHAPRKTGASSYSGKIASLR